MKSELNDDPLFKELAALPPCALDEATAARIRDRARAALPRGPRSGWLAIQATMASWRDRLEPLVVVSASASMLLWALRSVILLYS